MKCLGNWLPNLVSPSPDCDDDAALSVTLHLPPSLISRDGALKLKCSAATRSSTIKKVRELQNVTSFASAHAAFTHINTKKYRTIYICIPIYKLCPVDFIDQQCCYLT